MKINQIVGEHKKGFRAKKYSSKPKSYIEPVKPSAPKSPEQQKKEVNEAGDTIKQYEPGRSVTVDNPTTGVSTTVDLTKTPGALRPNDKGELELDPTPNQGTMGATAQPQTPKIAPGAPVNIVNDETSVSEDPGVPYYVDVSSGKPMAKTGGRGLTAIVPSKLWTAITPDIEAKAEAQGFIK